MKSGVVLVLGSERFLARDAVRKVVEACPDQDLSRYQGDSIVIGAVLDELRTPSLLSSGRLVVVENAGPALEGDALKALAAYAAAPVQGSVLVLQADKLDGRYKAAKELQAVANVVDCQAPHDRQVPAWVTQRARDAHGLQVGRDAAEALRARIGEDLGLLDAALSRLRDQIAPRTKLAAEDVVQSTEDHRSPVLFEAANALEDRDLPAMLAALEAAFAEGIRIKRDLVTDPGGIAPILLSNLHRAYVRLMRFHMTGDANSIGLSPRAVPYFTRRAEKHRFADLLARHHHFVAADLALKGSGDEPRQVMEILAVGLLGSGAPDRAMNLPRV
ncbi:MAG: DNA polymerase III subunit delta [Planctomycetota bacterium]